jgi:hypothetical protein
MLLHFRQTLPSYNWDTEEIGNRVVAGDVANGSFTKVGTNEGVADQGGTEVDADGRGTKR